MAETQYVEYHPSNRAFENRVSTYKIVNKGHIDVQQFFNDAFSVFESQQQQLLNEHERLKTCCVFEVILTKPHTPNDGGDGDDDDDGDANVVRENIQTFYISGEMRALAVGCSLRDWYDLNVVERMLSRLTEFEGEQSGWTVHSIDGLHVNNNAYVPLRGSSYFPTPKFIANKKATVNVQNHNDEMCFMWAILSALYPAKPHPDRVCHYREHTRKLDFRGIAFPVQVSDIDRFEKINPFISINVYVCKKNNKFSILRLCERVRDKHVNLLLMKKYDPNIDQIDDYDNVDDYVSVPHGKSHYIWIKDISKLLRAQITKHTSKLFFCDRCLSHKSSERKMNEHRKSCMNSGLKTVLKPPPTESTISFKNFKRAIPQLFMVYFDIECLLQPIATHDAEAKFSKNGHTNAYQKHVPFICGMFFKCHYDDTMNYYKRFEGTDCIEQFCMELFYLYKKVFPIFKKVAALNLTAREEAEFQAAKTCHICGRWFSKKYPKVRDHNHYGDGK